MTNSPQNPMLIHAVMLAPVTSPEPWIAPPEARISLFALAAKTRATIAGTIGQTIQEEMAKMSATMAFVDVGGAGG